MNASDGLQNPSMIDLAADREVPVVLPFLNGNDPKSLEFISWRSLRDYSSLV